MLLARCGGVWCRSFFFIRSSSEKLAYEELDEGLECGVLSEGPSLRVLEQMLSHIYMPVLMQMTGSDVPSAGVLLSTGSNQTHRELQGNMQKFLSQVSHALQQLNGDVTLQVSRPSGSPTPKKFYKASTCLG